METIRYSQKYTFCGSQKIRIAAVCRVLLTLVYFICGVQSICRFLTNQYTKKIKVYENIPASAGRYPPVGLHSIADNGTNAGHKTVLCP